MREAQQGAQLPVKLDHEAIVTVIVRRFRCQPHRLDEPAQRLGRLRSRLLPVERFVQRGDLGPVKLRQGRVKPGQGLGRRQGLEALLLGFQGQQSFLRGRGPDPVLDCAHDRLDLRFCLFEGPPTGGPVGIGFGLQPVPFRLELGHEGPHEVRREQGGLQTLQHACLDCLAPDRPAVVAGAAVAMPGAAVAVLADDRVGGPAGAALEQAGEQVARPVLAVEWVRRRVLVRPAVGDILLPVTDRLPERVVDDPERGHVLDDPVFRRIGPGLAPAALRVLDEALAVPDQPADIELVVEYADTAADIAVDGRRIPGPAGGTRHTRGVERMGNGPWRAAGGVVAEDPADGRRLCRVDAAAAGNRLAGRVMLPDDVVTERPTAGRAAGPDPALEAAPGLVGEILEVEGAHRALEPDVELADLAFGDRHQRDTEKREPLEEAGDMLLVAGEAVEALGHHDLEGAVPRVLLERLVARAEGRGAAHASVAIDAGEAPAAALDQALAEPHLVLDRGLALQVARIARVDRCPHGSILPLPVRLMFH
nr:hypothetical protein [Oceanibacterium hippocampi]